MTSRSAVAYTATPGYLFQTLLSAVQARASVGEDTEVHLVALASGRAARDELAAMTSVAESHRITVHRKDRALLDGLHPTWGRLFLDLALPEEVDRVLYLDGDTQVRGDLSALFDRPLGRGRLAGVRDPMVAIRRSHPRLRRRIDRDWDAAQLSGDARLGYVNCGVLLFHRADLALFRERVLRANAEHGARFTYADQDAINFELSGVMDHLALEWNYPGFLLDVDIAARDNARIVHFMSRPCPWQGSYRPWGRSGFQPYADLVRRHPELWSYWVRPRAARAARNRAQQLYKSCTEGRTWRSPGFRESMQAVYPDRLTGPAGAVTRHR